MSTKRNYLFINFFFIGVFLLGQNTSIHFDNLGKDDGLSYSLVSSIEQDDQGYMWIGTQDGLNRYDGYDFKVFRPQSQPNSIYHQAISSLYKDAAGRIWIRYIREGLSYYDPYTEHFYTFLHDAKDGNSISNDFRDHGFIASDQLFHEDKEGRLWIGTDHGLNLFRPLSNDFDQIIFNELGNDFRQPSIIAITSNQQGDLLIGTSKGVILYQPDSQKSSLLLPAQFGNNHYVTAVHVDKKGIIWVGTRQKGLFKIKIDENGKVLAIANYIQELKAESSDELAVIKIFEDKNEHLWFGVSDGLFFLEESKEEQAIFKKIAPDVIGDHKISQLHQDIHGKIWATSSDLSILWKVDTSHFGVQSFTHSPEDENSLGPNVVQAIFTDNKGVLWVGLEKGGLSKTNLYSKQFTHLNNNKSETSGIPNNDVYAIYVDENENLWIGTHDGLYRKNGATGEQKVYTSEGVNFGVNFNYSDKPSGKIVGVIEPTGDGSLWLGYFDYKISKFDPRKEIFQNFQHSLTQDSSFSMWSLRDICVTSDGSVFFGGTSNGLGQLLPDGKHFKFYLNDKNDSSSIQSDWVYTLYESEDGTLWLGTLDGGLARFDADLGVFKTYKHDPENAGSLSNNTVKCILEQHSPQGNRLWIGTERGINLFDPKTGVFRSYTTEDGLPSNNIHGIIEDDHGRLWLSSNGGISCFDPTTQQFTNYNKEDGLQGNEFNQGAYFKDSKGQIYFGGLNGVTVFHPDSLQQNPFTPKLMITDFLVNNETIKPGDDVSGRIILDKAIGFTDKIILGAQQKVISVSFTAFHYAAPSKIKYRYKLEPFETKWNEGGAENRSINYTNIPPGKYLLMLECSSIDGEWGADSKTLELIVLPPFWKTTWFKIVFFLFMLSAVLGLIYFRTRGLEKQKKVLKKEVRKRTKELKLKSRQLKQTNLELNTRQEEIIDRNKKIAEQRDHLEIHNQELVQQKKESIWMAEQLHESDQSKLSFFTNISHEFRTPLSLIIGPTESLLARSDFSDTEKVKESLLLMYRSEKRLLRLINQLLEIRRVESGTLEFHGQLRDVLLFSRELLALFQPLALRKQISLEFNAIYKEIQLWFDADKLEKILFNLLSNAFKHTPKGGKISLSLKKNENQDQVLFSVANSGKGISEKDSKHIFDRFVHSVQNRNNKELSFGIGLSLVKDLVELHGGQVSVEALKEGTCFTVCLPIRKPDDGAVDVQTSLGFSFARSMIEDVRETSFLIPHPNTSKTEHGADIPIVLLVEDNADMLYFLSDNLQQNYKVLTAENGEEGIKLALQHIPDLIVSDVMMPGVDGLELTQTLKNDKRSSHIPILLLTAKAGLPSEMAGLESGADAYLTKPFDLKALNLRLKNMLETRQNFMDSIGKTLPSIPKHINVKTIDQGLLEDIIKIIDTNINDENFSGDQLARELGMSKGSLYRKLKGLTGMTVNIFIRTFRLKVAAQLLQKGNCNISEVAYAVGFDNPKYFSVCFKQLFSQTPREYMNEGLKE